MRFSSCFPFQRGRAVRRCRRAASGRPPPSLKVRWKGARFVPLSVVEALLAGPAAGRGALERGRPERVPGAGRMERRAVPAAIRSGAAVDRLTGDVAAHRTGVPGVRSGAGLWGVAPSRTRRPSPLGGAGPQAACACWPIPVSAESAPAAGAGRAPPEFRGRRAAGADPAPGAGRVPSGGGARTPARRRPPTGCCRCSARPDGQRGLGPGQLLASDPRRPGREPRRPGR